MTVVIGGLAIIIDKVFCLTKKLFSHFQVELSGCHVGETLLLDKSGVILRLIVDGIFSTRN